MKKMKCFERACLNKRISMEGGAIAGIIIGTLIGVALIVWAVYEMQKWVARRAIRPQGNLNTRETQVEDEYSGVELKPLVRMSGALPWHGRRPPAHNFAPSRHVMETIEEETDEDVLSHEPEQE